MEERTNVTLYNLDGNIFKAYYDVEKWHINDNGWIYIQKNDETIIYNRDVIGKIAIDHR